MKVTLQFFILSLFVFTPAASTNQRAPLFIKSELSTSQPNSFGLFQRHFTYKFHDIILSSY